MEVWPKGACLGLTKKRLLGSLATFSVVLVLLLVDYAHARYKAYRARQILSDIRTLIPGKATAEDARRLASRYQGLLTPREGCTAEDCSYGMILPSCAGYALVSTSELLSSLLWRACDSETLNFLGFRQWVVVASIKVRHSRVHTVGSNVAVEGPGHLWFDAGWEFFPENVSNSSQERETFLIQRIRESGDSYVYWHHLHMGAETGEGLQWAITPATVLEKREAAFNINMDCLTKPVGCARMRELAPMGWKYIDRSSDPFW